MTQPQPMQQPVALGQDPSQLNFEGSTFQPGISQTTPYNKPDVYSIDQLANQLQEFTGGMSGLRLPANWREMAVGDPDALLRQVGANIEAAKQGRLGDNRLHADTSMRNRLDDWFRKFSGAVKQGGANPNPDYQIGALGRQVFTGAIERLKMTGASDGRAQDEQLMALLASRGLSNSGIAARELGKLQRDREQNFYDAANRLNEMILTGEIGRLTQRDLATLEADLQKRNQEAYLKIQERMLKESQPNPWIQGLTTLGGVGLGAVLSPKAPPPPGGTGIFEGVRGGKTSGLYDQGK